MALVSATQSIGIRHLSESLFFASRSLQAKFQNLYDNQFWEKVTTEKKKERKRERRRKSKERKRNSVHYIHPRRAHTSIGPK